MMKEIKETCYKGTRILLGHLKRNLIHSLVNDLYGEGFTEISIPIIQSQIMYKEKVGGENLSLMFNFEDRAGRPVCLAPEYTSVIQQLAKTSFREERDLKLFYVQECFRGEKPQAGRYRQFTQLGVEIINPTKDYMDYMDHLSVKLLEWVPGTFEWNWSVARGLDYYKEGKGFEIICEELGAQKQICGGGEYEGGVGFALGIDRLLLLYEKHLEDETKPGT